VLRRREESKQRGNRRRRLLFGLAVVGAGVLFAGGLAFAASQTIVGQSDNTFSAPTYTTDQGEVAQLQVTGSTHNATARQNGPDGQALFRSPSISGGTAGVQGTQYLSAGDYVFFCTIHPTTMQATLHVTSNGAPQARPASSIKVARKNLKQTIKKGLKLNMTPTTRVEGVTLTAKLGKTTIAKATTTLLEGFNAPVLKLNKAGKGKLSKKKTAKVTVTAEIPFGSPVSAKAKLS
jgi:plastocyanin